MPEPTRFWLIRHAEPDFGGERVCLGRKLDVPLSARGREQAVALAERLRFKKLDEIYISPLLRAIQTADALLQQCPRLIAPELTEVSGGEWDGMRFADIYARYPEYFDGSESGDMPPPGGESDAEALERGMALLNRLTRQEGKTFALVTHSGLGRILLCHLLEVPMRIKRSIPMDYTSCTRLEFSGGLWRVDLSESMPNNLL